MIKIQKYENLGNHNMGWLDARYHFSFARYYNPKQMGFGKLLVINDDIIHAKGGFDTHRHDNMEIITYVRQGAITHKDSEGNEGRTAVGDVQVMSAGTGIAHSEYNHENEDTKLYQIWIQPRVQNVKPRWESGSFPVDFRNDDLQLLVSGRPEDEGKGALYINQYASIYGGRIMAGRKLIQPIHDNTYVLISEGEVEVDGSLMKKGDGAEITGVKFISLEAKRNCEVIVIDVPA
jgi:redox-sensitive bicupin YhaK (pirin superfamily)